MKRIAIVSVVFTGVFFLLLSFYVYWQGIDRHSPLVMRCYIRFCKKIGKKGVVRLQGESPANFAERVKKIFPGSSDTVDDITHDFYQLAYCTELKPQDREYRDLLRSFRKKVFIFRLVRKKNNAH